MVVIFVKELIHVISSEASQRLPLYGPNTCNLWEGVYLPHSRNGVWITIIGFLGGGNFGAISGSLFVQIDTV